MRSLPSMDKRRVTLRRSGTLRKSVFYNHIRQQLNEQLKCLDVRMETQVAIVSEVQDYFRRRAEVELEYSRSLDKLARSVNIRHKAEKQKREQWHLFSTHTCWQELLNLTRRQSKDHAVLGEIYSTNMINRFTQAMEDVQRMYRRCREVGYESHEELLKVLHELHTAMKTYQGYHGEMKQAEGKLRYVESQRSKLEQSIPREKLEKSKKFRLIEKEIQKRQSKFNDTKLKAVKARNEYLLCMDAANAAIHKYFVDDLSDLMDCMDFGFHNSMARGLLLHVSAEECLKRSQQTSVDGMNKCVSSLDSRLDKQRFLEYNNACFMMPRKFEFQGHKGDEISEFCTDKSIVDELEQRQKQLSKRLTALKTESEEIWKTLETAEKSLMDMINLKDYDCSALFADEDRNGIGAKQPEAVAIKLRADRQETEDFYLNKFREYTLGSNLIARLTSKHDLLRHALGDQCIERSGIGGGGGSSPRVATLNRQIPLAPNKLRRRRIGRTPLVGQPKLFGGSLEEYLEATNQEIPLIVRSCVRIINLYGLHHQGIFRVSGSQVEINNFKEAFEREEDPLSDMTDASDINSVAGVMKLYLRELREPLFPIYYFDQFMEISQLESKPEFVVKVRDLITSLPRPVFVVMRYLFAFLNHLSEFSDENMMDPYNLAICFGPTLLPIPEDRDQVQFQNLVNELIKHIIIYQEEIFPTDGGIMYEKYISTNVPDENDVGEAPAEHISEDDSELGNHSEDAEQASGDRDISMQLFGKSEILEAVAQFDFTARSERELSFKKGDSLTLYSQVSNDWWRGSIDGVIGLIPDKYIMLKMRDEDKEKASSDDSIKQRRTSSSSDSYGGLLSPRQQSNRQMSASAIGCTTSSTSRTSGECVGGGGGLTHSTSASHIGDRLGDEDRDRPRRRSRSPSAGSLQHTPARSLERRHHVSSSDKPVSVSLHCETVSLNLSPNPNPAPAPAPAIALAPTVAPTSPVSPMQPHNVSLNWTEQQVPSQDLERDLDSALAHVISTIETLEKKQQQNQHPPRKDPTPDLVLDLPVNPSSPTARVQRVPDSPEPDTAAERFAQSNQCTLKKGSVVSRSSTNVPGVLLNELQISSSSARPAGSGGSGPPGGFRRSTSTHGDLGSNVPQASPLQTHRVETIEIRSPSMKIRGMQRNLSEDSSCISVNSTTTTFKPQVKIKPPVMKKPASPLGLSQSALPCAPSPDPVRKHPDRELKQTSC